MTVVTHHVRQMLIAATDLAEQVEQGQFPDAQVPAALERAANLAEHAGAELRDEMLRARDGWGFV